MNRRWMAACGMAVVMGLSCGAWAQQEEEVVKPRPRNDGPARSVAAPSAGTIPVGSLSQTELLKRYDKDKDGVLSPAEAEEARRDLAAKRQELIKSQAQVAKGNGKAVVVKEYEGVDGLSASERGRIMRIRMGARDFSALMLQYDRNQDGELGADELKVYSDDLTRARAQFNAQRELERAEFIKTHDKDADGTMSLVEARAALDAITAVRRARVNEVLRAMGGAPLRKPVNSDAGPTTTKPAEPTADK